MKKNIFALLYFVLSFGNFIQAQDFPAIDTGEFYGARISLDKTYNGQSLFGYIDGGAELYLAYGFDQLRRQEIDVNGEKLTILIYKMHNPQAAFGIYSIYSFKCDSVARLTRSECASPYVYSAERNQYYYSIINQTGSRQARQLSSDFAKILAGKIHPDSIPWPDIFNYDLFIGSQKSLKFIQGSISLLQVLPDWSKYFTYIQNYSLWYLPVTSDQAARLSLALLKFNNANDRKVFIKNTSLKMLKEGDKYIGKSSLGWKIGDNDLVFLEINEFADPLDPYINAIYQFVIKTKEIK